MYCEVINNYDTIGKTDKIGFLNYSYNESSINIYFINDTVAYNLVELFLQNSIYFVIHYE